MAQRVLSAAALAAFCLTAAPAWAQEKGQVSVAIAYPASVGVVWHLVDPVAVRPDVTFGQSTNEVTVRSTFTFNNQTETTETRASSSNTTASGGVSGLFYASKRDSVSGVGVVLYFR